MILNELDIINVFLNSFLLCYNLLGFIDLMGFNDSMKYNK